MLTIKLKASKVKYRLKILRPRDDFHKRDIDKLIAMIEYVDDDDVVLVDEKLFDFLKFT